MNQRAYLCCSDNIFNRIIPETSQLGVKLVILVNLVIEITGNFPLTYKNSGKDWKRSRRMENNRIETARN